VCFSLQGMWFWVFNYAGKICVCVCVYVYMHSESFFYIDFEFLGILWQFRVFWIKLCVFSLRIAHYIGRIYKLRKEIIQHEIIQADTGNNIGWSSALRNS
jgi:hypothetical protein